MHKAAITMMGNPNSGIARGELRSTLSRAGSCRSSGQHPWKPTGAKTPQSAPVKFNMKNDVGKRAGSAHVNLGTSAGYMTTSFGPATLSGNVLTMTATSTGQSGHNGKFYPFRSTQKITGIRIYTRRSPLSLPFWTNEHPKKPACDYIIYWYTIDYIGLGRNANMLITLIFYVSEHIG